MAKKKVVLITGVASYWGGKVATKLLSTPGYRVIGLDSEPPKEIIKGLSFIQADIRNSLLPELFKTEGIDILAHLAFVESNLPDPLAFDLNVMGTMKVFAAAAQAGVRKIILRSSTAAYGALPTNSAYLHEDHPLIGNLHTGHIANIVEMEKFCNEFHRHTPDVLLTVLRFPNIIGPTVDSPMTRFLKLPITPILLGFNPPMQFIHETDAIDAMLYVIDQDVPGVFNVAAEGIISLDKLIAMTGRIPFPIFHLLPYLARETVGKSINFLMPIELEYIRYSWVADLSRMREKLGFYPKYTAEEALREFAGYLRLKPFMSEAINNAFSK